MRSIERRRLILPDIPSFVEGQLSCKRAVLEVLERGLDPKKHRTFRGRVLLEARCEKRGHILARVYPTSQGPLLIPSVSGLPLGRNGKKEQRFSGEHYEFAKHWRTILELSGNPDPRGYRDRWIQEYAAGDDAEDSEYFTIFGLTLLGEQHRRETVLIEERDIEVVPTFYLLCRCGTELLATVEVMRALDAGQRVLLPAMYRRPVN
ncbi:hypothetical protein [Amycolatopsis sp. NPDC003861]